MGKLKVLHITFDMRIGGTEQVIKNLIENSDSDLFEMSILCIESPLGPFADDLKNKGISITALSRQPGFDLNIVRQIHRYIKQHQNAIVHCHQYTPWVYGVLGAIGTKAKVIFTEHGRFYPDTSSFKRKLINPWLHRLTDATTAISQATKDALATYENIPIKDIQVIYNGLNPLAVDNQQVEQIRKDLGIGKNTLCLGTIARLDPIKNHTMMLQAFRKVIDSGIAAKLLIVGDGDMRQTLSDLIIELKLENLVIMPGYQAKPQNHLALMDIFLLPSLSEGTSMTLLEAMAESKVCVVTDVGGNPEIIKHQESGLVTPNDNVNAYADAIIRLARNPELRKEMATQARERFDTHFSAACMAQQFKTLYQSLASI